MTVLERLKLELNNKQYFSDDEYMVFLEENNLNPDDDYNKNTMRVNLLYTIIDVLEVLMNNLGMYRVQIEFIVTF